MDQNLNPANLSENDASGAMAVASGEAAADEADVKVPGGSASQEMLQLQLQELKAEIAIVRARLTAITQQAEAVAEGNIRWIDACAHEQLGPHPWLKLFGAALAAFLTGRLMRRVPLSLVAIAAKPLLMTAIRTTAVD